MVKIRVYYDDNREIVELIRLLSPRMSYCKTHPKERPKRANLGIETEDLLAHDLESGEDDGSPNEEGGNEDAE